MPFIVSAAGFRNHKQNLPFFKDKTWKSYSLKKFVTGTVVNCTCYSINWNYITYRTEALNISEQEPNKVGKALFMPGNT